MRTTAEAARRFLVARHMLTPARSLEGGPGAVLEAFRKFGSIQFDPLAVAGRNHDLVLHARVADYEPDWCELLYERRDIFEAYNKGRSLVPTSEFARNPDPALITLMPTATAVRIITFAVVGTAIVILSTKTPAYGP